MPNGITITIVSWLFALAVAGIAVVLVQSRTRQIMLDWFYARFNSDFTDPDYIHRILVKKDEDGGGLIPGEGWRDAVRTGVIVVTIEVALIILVGLILPNWWKLLGIAIFGGLLAISAGLWASCLTKVTEREVVLLFRKDHFYGFLRPGWYLILRPFGFEAAAWRVERNRREARDLTAQDVLLGDNLLAGFDLMITMEVQDLHERAQFDIRHPDSALHPATDIGAPPGAGELLVEEGDFLPWNLQAPYLRVFRYRNSEDGGEDELAEEIEKGANTISFLYCLSSTWEELKAMLEKPSHTIPVEESMPIIQAAISAATEDADKNERKHASLQQLIRNYLELTLREAGIRIVDVRIKKIVPPPALLATKTAELEGEAELRKLEKITKAIEKLGDLANSPAANFFLTQATIEAWQKTASSSGAVIVGTPKDLVEKLEIDLRRGSGSAGAPPK